MRTRPNHLLMLLGHYDQIPCDSVVREYLGMSPKAGAEGGRAGGGEAVRALGAVSPSSPIKFERVFKRLNYVDIVDGKKM